MEKKNNNERDKISSLPDSILHHIFSFLGIEEAIQSTVLSKRWRDLWTSLHILNFEYGCPEDGDFECITDFVDKVFILRDNSNIQRFDFFCQSLSSRYVNDWIISALRRNVEELVIEFCYDDLFRLPHSLFNSKSLTILKLFSCDSFLKLNIPHSMCLPSLKIVTLHSAQFVDDDETNRFFSSCPVLESLTVADSVFHHTNLKISLLLLKHLELQITENVGEDFGSIDGSVTLCTPNLISFYCKDYMRKNYALENLSSLVKADFYLEEDNELLSHPLEEKRNMYGQRMLKFLGALHNVTKLTLPAPILEVVSGPALLANNLIYHNLRSLKMYAPFSGDCVHTIICLLKLCPVIETLFVNINEINVNSSMMEETWEVRLSSECLLNHLKRVEIREAKGCVNELKLLETLLRNAVVLESLMIVFASTEASVTDRETRFVKFAEKLRAFPKASSNITIMLI